MSNRYKGAILSATPPTVVASVDGEGGTASGSWSLGQQIGYAALGTWPKGFFDRQLWSWAYNGSGQLGLGNTTDYSSPKQVGSLTTWYKITAGTYDYAESALAIKNDGTLWSWGVNQKGQLGLGNITSYSSPKQVGALTTWLNIAGGSGYSLATKTDGTLWAWGRNYYGQLGLGNTTEYSSPKQVGALTTWSNAYAGYTHALATKTDGTLWSWGQNNYGALGLGNITNYSSPKQVGALTTWLNIVGGYYNTIAIKTDGTLWSWGYNPYGQLGLGNTTYFSSPKQVGSLTTWSKITSGRLHTIATKTDGTLWTWGANSFGRLGLGNTTYYSSPKQVGALTTWTKALSSGMFNAYSRCIRSDGTLWAWGRNSSGQLGLGNITSYSSPKQVGSLTTWLNIAAGSYLGIALKTP